MNIKDFTPGQKAYALAARTGCTSEPGKRELVIVDVGPRHARIPCRLASTVYGWCTVVTDGGAIIQEWAGSFSVA